MTECGNKEDQSITLQKAAAVRQYLNITKVGFFRRLGIDWASKHIEYKVTRPRTIELICRYFHIDPAYFTDTMTVDQLPEAVDDHVQQCSIDQRITALREEKGINRKELAEAVGVSGSFISAIELGNRRVTREKAERIADYFDVGAEYLLTGDEKYKNYPINEEVISWLWDHEEWRRFLRRAKDSGKSPEEFAKDFCSEQRRLKRAEKR